MAPHSPCHVEEADYGIVTWGLEGPLCADVWNCAEVSRKLYRYASEYGSISQARLPRLICTVVDRGPVRCVTPDGTSLVCLKTTGTHVDPELDDSCYLVLPTRDSLQGDISITALFRSKEDPYLEIEALRSRRGVMSSKVGLAAPVFWVRNEFGWLVTGSLGAAPLQVLFERPEAETSYPQGTRDIPTRNRTSSLSHQTQDPVTTTPCSNSPLPSTRSLSDGFEPGSDTAEKRRSVPLRWSPFTYPLPPPQNFHKERVPFVLLRGRERPHIVTSPAFHESIVHRVTNNLSKQGFPFVVHAFGAGLRQVLLRGLGVRAEIPVLLLETCKGSVRDLGYEPDPCTGNPRLMETSFLHSTLSQTLFALQVLQETLGFKHNDLSCQNIFLVDCTWNSARLGPATVVRPEFQVKIADYGFASLDHPACFVRRADFDLVEESAGGQRQPWGDFCAELHKRSYDTQFFLVSLILCSFGVLVATSTGPNARVLANVLLLMDLYRFASGENDTPEQRLEIARDLVSTAEGAINQPSVVLDARLRSWFKRSAPGLTHHWRIRRAYLSDRSPLDVLSRWCEPPVVDLGESTPLSRRVTLEMANILSYLHTTGDSSVEATRFETPQTSAVQDLLAAVQGTRPATPQDPGHIFAAEWSDEEPEERKESIAAAVEVAWSPVTQISLPPAFKGSLSSTGGSSSTVEGLEGEVVEPRSRVESWSSYEEPPRQVAHELEVFSAEILA